MKIKHYGYEACPYCIRVNLALGLKNIPYESVFLDFYEKDTQIRLVGEKTVPILEFPDGKAMKGSLDIIEFLDKTYGNPILKSPEKQAQVEAIIFNMEYKSVIYGLLMPRYYQMNLPELKSQQSQDLVRQNFEPIIGMSLETALTQTPVLLEKIKPILTEMDRLFDNEKTIDREFSYADIVLLPTVILLSTVKGIPFTDRLKNYIVYWCEKTNVSHYFDRAI